MLTLLAILLGLLVVGGIVGFMLHDVLLARVRAQHPDLWQILGSPDKFFDDGGLAGFRAVRRLYHQPDLRQRYSSEVLGTIKRTRAYGRIYLLLAVVTMAVFTACLGRIL